MQRHHEKNTPLNDVSLTLRLSHETFNRLERKARKNNISISRIVRHMIEDSLNSESGNMLYMDPQRAEHFNDSLMKFEVYMEELQKRSKALADEMYGLVRGGRL